MTSEPIIIECKVYLRLVVMIALVRFLRFYLTDKTTGWPTKMSLFFFGNNFYKNKETFKIFSLLILEVYRIFLM